MINFDDKSPEEIFDLIREACAKLGWDIAMDMSHPGITGAILGIREYVDSIVSQLNEEENYDIYSQNTENLEMH